MFAGRSEAGKTTLTQAMKGDTITYHKTQYVNFYDVIIDTPGEYAETSRLGYALEIFSYEADVVGLLLSAIEPYSLYPPCVTAISTRECIGIVTKIDHPLANPQQAAEWLRLAGCEKIFFVSSYTGEGVSDILEYLKEPGEVLPWEEIKDQEDHYDGNDSHTWDEIPEYHATEHLTSEERAKLIASRVKSDVLQDF